MATADRAFEKLSMDVDARDRQVNSFKLEDVARELTKTKRDLRAVEDHLQLDGLSGRRLDDVEQRIIVTQETFNRAEELSHDRHIELMVYLKSVVAAMQEKHAAFAGAVIKEFESTNQKISRIEAVQQSIMQHLNILLNRQ